MTPTTQQGFELDREFAATPSAVFAAWTTPAHFARWFGGESVRVLVDSLDFEPTVGGTWFAAMVLPDGTEMAFYGEFLDVVVDRRLVFTMTDDPDQPERVVYTVQLAPSDRGTALRLTAQAPMFDDGWREGTMRGWGAVLDVIGVIVESC